MSRGEFERARTRKRRRTAFIALAVVVALVLGGAGAAFAYYSVLSGNLHDGVDAELRAALADTDLVNEPFYLLLMGTDGSDEREASEAFAGDQFRSDSIMLARIDPVGKKVTLVSLHRDTLVDMGEYGQNKLNAAHAIGGPAMSVKVVSELAGVPISHYAEINFDGFKDIVDALGGVEVDVPMTIDDADAGGHLDEGLQTLNGDQALILCRSRHAYDQYGDGDSFRAANQRLVLSAIAKKLLAADVATMAGTVQALSQYVTTDLEITDIIGLAQAMQGLDPSTDIYSAMEPTTSQYINGVWYEINDVDEWKKMMARVDQGLPPTEEDIVDEGSNTVLATTGNGDASAVADAAEASRRQNTVLVLNGNGTPGAGSVAAERIKALGYEVSSDNADNFDYERTMIVYDDEGRAEDAQEVADALGTGELVLNDGSYETNGGLLVILGSDW
ncbi:transcriptional regulator [Gordonibacter sp. An230]|uniref:LCP family protein n=1 Tax=Gordonibacter sp. An230 TaxID=1965592 RepID=UPI000B36D6DB|nr:LCP family protein [Gordonibacter sp. An230]OUO91017.1 transcriptional regulator [Gordonibacter sp. An230]